MPNKTAHLRAGQHFKVLLTSGATLEGDLEGGSGQLLMINPIVIRFGGGEDGIWVERVITPEAPADPRVARVADYMKNEF